MPTGIPDARRVAPAHIFDRVWLGVRLALMVCCILASGCSIFGIAAYKMSGDQSMEAKYNPPERPLLVLVENELNPATLRLDSDRLGEEITLRLEQKTSVPVIDYTKLRDLRAQSPDAYRAMAITRIGQALNAEQVMVVNLVEFGVQPAVGSEAYQGKAEARVRIVDCASGETRWPLDLSGGYPVTVQTTFTRTREGVEPRNIADGLHRTLSEKVSRLFYTWKSEAADDPNASE